MLSKEKWKYLSTRLILIFCSMYFFSLLLLAVIFIGTKTSRWSFFLLFFMVLIHIICFYLCYLFVVKPHQETRKMMRVFAKGYTVKSIFELRYPFCPEEEAMLRRFQQLLAAKDLINLSKKQAEYLALQNQINPHFLYNTLEGIRSEALFAGVEGVAKMSEALALFFRYTISNLDNLATLEDELKNVENYYIIQQFRFEDRLEIRIDLEKENEQTLLNAKMPKLILQPIVENSICHGLEEKVGKGIVRIRVNGTKDRLLISISDNGLGISEENVQKLNRKLRKVELIGEEGEKETGRGGIALTNVNSRIQILFGEEYGLYVYSTLNEGTEVEITLPYLMK